MTNTPPAEGANDDMIGMLADSARDFCARALPVDRLRGLRATTPAFDKAQWQAMAELGWLGITVAESRGGLGLGAAGAAAVCRELGRVAAPEPLIETAVAAAGLLESLNADDALLASVISGEMIASAALHGVDAGCALAPPTLANGTLDGEIDAVPLGRDADAFLVPAMRDGVLACCLVTSGDAGLDIEPRPLGDGTSNARLRFSGAQVQVLGASDAAVRAWTTARARATLASAAYQLGLADSMLQMTLDYAGTRQQFGQHIGAFQSLQHRLVDCYMALRLAEAVFADCVVAADGGDGELENIASRAGQQVAGALAKIAREAIQIHGAIGYTDECDVGLFANRAVASAARFGRQDVHLARIVRHSRGIEAPPLLDIDDDDSLMDLEPPQGDWNALDNETFRKVVRQWHTAHYPDSLRNLHRRARWDQCRDWYEKLFRRGFAAPGWPREHGGMGLAPDKLLIFIDERERLGVVRTPDQGIIMVGPLLMQHGSPEQQAHYLPKALSGEHIWCQGYSEPNAGSDLASLRTSAVREGDEFVINGQKIWTTMAQDANQMFCLVRTDQQAKPQAGISFILIDFASPGITVRPIRNIAGDEEFCEVFFDDVRVPCSNLVGELNDGWTIAKALLGFERFFIGSPKYCRNALARAAELAHVRGLANDPVTVDRYTRFALEVDALEALYKEFADLIRRGEVPGADISMLKIFASETFQSLSEFVLDLGAEAAAQVAGVGTDSQSIDSLHAWYNARPTTIYGGSNEIQRNILAKAVLRLPSR